MDLRACANNAPDAPLVRGMSEAAPGIIAAVCGNLEAHNTLTVNGSGLAVSNDWVVSAPAHVGGAAFVGGKLEATNTVTVDGALHTTETHLTNVSAASITTAGSAADGPLQCGMAPVTEDAIQRVEAAGFIDLGAALSAHSESADVNLGCAHYRFTSWGIDNGLTLHVSGATTIIVEGDVRISSPVRVELAPDSTLDFVVGGSLQVDNTLSFSCGSTWLAVGGAIRIAAPTTLTGFLFAPQSTVSLDNTLDIVGSLFVGSTRVAAPLTVTPLPGTELPTCATAH